MKALTIPASVCKMLERLEPVTRQILLGHVYDYRVLGLLPDVTEECETIRFVWPLIVSEYVRLEKEAERKRTVRGQSAVTPSPSPKEKKSPHPLKEKDTSSSNPSLDQTLFDRWWQMYPRHVGKKAARTKFFAILKKSNEDHTKLVEKMISAVYEQERKLEWSKDRIQYIPHPLTWLNQGRWEDEVEAIGSERRTGPRKADNWIGTPPEKIEEVF